MKKLLWLDDLRNPSDPHMNWLSFSPIGTDVEVTWVKNYKEFISWIKKNGLPDGVCFDHDLGETKKEKTGYDAAIWMVEYCLDNNLNPPPYGIQSSNPVGKLNISTLINNYKNHRKDDRISRVKKIHRGGKC